MAAASILLYKGDPDTIRRIACVLPIFVQVPAAPAGSLSNCETEILRYKTDKRSLPLM